MRRDIESAFACRAVLTSLVGSPTIISQQIRKNGFHKSEALVGSI
jgi:hypothetical protein